MYSVITEYNDTFLSYYRYLLDVMLAYEEDGQMIASAYQDGIRLSATYSRAKKQNNGCCGQVADDSDPKCRR